MKTSTLIEKRILAWLCRKHYNGILIVCKIRSSLRSGIPNTSITNFIRQEFNHQLQPHFVKEEDWLFPKLPGGNPLRVNAEKQHAQLRSMANSIAEYPVIQPHSLCEAFADLLEENIRFEERTLFPFIENIMNEQESKNSYSTS